MKAKDGRTVLHHVASSESLDNSSKLECVKTKLALYPESELLQVVCLKDREGITVLHHAVESVDPEMAQHIISVLPESQRSQAINSQDLKGNTILQYLNESLNLLPKANSSPQKRSRDIVLQTPEDESGTKRQRLDGSG